MIGMGVFLRNGKIFNQAPFKVSFYSLFHHNFALKDEQLQLEINLDEKSTHLKKQARRY